MYLIFGFLLFIILTKFFLIYKYNKKREKNIYKIKNNWGKPKVDGYFNFEVIEQYFLNTTNSNAFHVISDRTKNDLDFNELFKFLDRTSSKIGQQYLYYKLRVIQNKEENTIFNELVALFTKDEDLRLKCELQLSILNTHDAYDLEKLIHNPLVKTKSYKYLVPLSLGALFSIVLGFLNPIFFIFLIPIYAVNLVLHFKNKQSVNYLLSAVNQLRLSLQVGENILANSEIKKHFFKDTFIKEVKKIEFTTKFIAFQQKLTSDFIVLIWYVIELVKVIFNIEAIIFYKFIDSVIEKNKSIDALYQFIGIIDAAISTVSVKATNITCTPKFTNNKLIEITKVSHPLIKDCIANDIKLINNSLLLTGSNMSGKTTFIRTIAVNTILAQTLNFAFAEKFTVPFLKIYSSIKISDNLLEDTSYYLKEVLIINELIKASKEKAPCLFILDEIFKGTNTIERISGGKAILSYLNRENHFVFVSTHDIELTDLLINEKFDLYHFSEKIEDNKLLFDHKLKKGKLKTRNAIKILELYNYPSKLINDAKDTVIKISK